MEAITTTILYTNLKCYAGQNPRKSMTNLESIKWEHLGISYDDKINRITYEEVIDDTRPIQTKKVLGVEVGTGASI